MPARLYWIYLEELILYHMWQFLSTANGQTVAQDEAPGLQRIIAFLREKFWIIG